MPRLTIFTALILLAFSSWGASPVLVKYDSADSLPKKFKELLSSDLENASYKVGTESRSDKVFFAIEHTYLSRLSKEDLEFYLDPQNEHFHLLFSDPLQLELVSGDQFNAKSSINVLVDTLNFSSQLTYLCETYTGGSSHNYDFDKFNMFFLASKFKINIIEENGGYRVQILQLATIKGSAFSKISRVPFGESTFRKRIIGNLKKMEKITGVDK